MKPSVAPTLDYDSPKILVLGPPGLQTTALNNQLWGFPSSLNALSKELETILESICAANKVEYLEISSIGVSELDGIHFTREHQPLLANLVAEKVKTMLK